VAIKAAPVGDVAAAFGVDTGTLWRWGQQLSATEVGGLVPNKRGPKGPSRLTDDMDRDIRARRAAPAGRAAGDRRRGRSLHEHGPAGTAITRTRGSGIARTGGPLGTAGDSCPMPNRCLPTPQGCRWRGCWPSPPWKPPGCCLVPGGFRVSTQRVLRPGYDAARRGFAGAGR
jgi:hypothetical protein